jgi:hypothetical protein
VFGRPPGSWACPARPPNGCWPKRRGGGEGWPKYLDLPCPGKPGNSGSQHLHLGVLAMSSFWVAPLRWQVVLANGLRLFGPQVCGQGAGSHGNQVLTDKGCPVRPSKSITGRSWLHLYRTPQRAADCCKPLAAEYGHALRCAATGAVGRPTER